MRTGATRWWAAAVIALTGAVLLSGCTSATNRAEREAPLSGPVTTSYPQAARMCPAPDLGAGTTRVSHDAGTCPLGLPLGPNQARLVGIHLQRPVSFDIPEPGWSARTAGEGGFELTGPGGEVITVFPYPLLLGSGPDPTGADRMLMGVRARVDVSIVDAGPWAAGTRNGVWMDLTTAPQAPTTTDCRTEAPCLPLVVPMLEAVTAEPLPSTMPVVELRPGVVSRLLVEQAEDARLEAAVWVHQRPADASPAEHVVASLRFGEATEAVAAWQ